MRSQRLGPAGFTLIELMVTLTLMALALAVAGPALTPPTSLSSGYRDLSRALEGARREAARTGEQIELWIDSESGEHRRVRARDGTAWFGRGPYQPVEEGESGAGESRWRRIVFNPTGLTTGASFLIAGDSTSPVTVSIARWSGRVHVTPRP